MAKLIVRMEPGGANSIWAVSLRCGEVIEMNHGILRKWANESEIDLESKDTLGPVPKLEDSHLELCREDESIDEIRLCDMQVEVVGRSFDPTVETEPQVFRVSECYDGCSIEGLESVCIPQGDVNPENFKVLCKEIPDCWGEWQKVVIGLSYLPGDGTEYSFEILKSGSDYWPKRDSPYEDSDDGLGAIPEYYKFAEGTWTPIDEEDLVKKES